MKKKQSEKPAVPTDQVVKIYNEVFYLLDYLRTMASQQLQLPSAFENGSNGEIHWTEPKVDRCWENFDLYMRMYLQTIQAFDPKLREIRALRMDPIVCDAIFRTFADKQREAAYIDDAVRFIEKGFHLFRRLFEEGVVVEDRTKEVFSRRFGKCTRIWQEHSYEIQDIEGLKSGLKWELATIHNRRSPVQSTSDQTPEQVKNTARKGSNRKVHKNRKELLIAALLDRHRFNRPGTDLDQTPASMDDLAKITRKSSPTVSRAFKDLGIDYEKYERICRDYGTLHKFLERLDNPLSREKSNRETSIRLSEDADEE
jgi:hypothetical protein